MPPHIGNSTGGCRVSSVPRPYAATPLTQLVADIVQRSDRQALQELHDHRPLFRGVAGVPMLMGDFLLELRERDITFRWCGRDPVTVDHAYDLTLAKFLNLPADGIDGPDCRHYYGAFYDYTVARFQQLPPPDPITAETRAAALLQQLVTRHFYLSCLESRRRALKLVRRYRWRVNGAALVVWLPVEMTGKRCRNWLEANVTDVDPTRPGERDRVQGIVDRLLARRRVLSLDRLSQSELRSAAQGDRLGSGDDIFARGLAAVVADEKAENLADQRPSIRALGGPAVKRLVETVFESLAGDGYRADRIAGTFGLSKPSFSRFAGCRWTRDSGASGKEDIPDLWKNTAHVVASHEDFAAVAQRAGVWDQVRRALGAADRQEGGIR